MLVDDKEKRPVWSTWHDPLFICRAPRVQRVKRARPFPPNGGRSIAEKKDDNGWSDEVIEWDAEHDNGYRGIDPALYPKRTNAFPVRGHDASPIRVVVKDTHNDQKRI